MPVNIAAVRDRVQKILLKLVGRVEVDANDDLTFPFESTRLYVRTEEWQDSAIVSVFAVTNFGIPPSPELFHYVATAGGSWIFGHLSANEQPEGVNIVFRYTILGDFLDPQELRGAIGAVAQAADEIDEDVQARFGGRTVADL